MKNPLWIVIDDGDTFEGHQGHWADCYFSNATESDIRYALEDRDFLVTICGEYSAKIDIREMTDEELARFPEAVKFQEFLMEQYGEV